MKDQDARWESLNAYVDGELAAPQAARVAREIASNRDSAKHAALLASLKAVVGECHEERAPRAVLDQGAGSGRARLAWAAVVVLGIFGGVFFAVRGASPPTPIQAARAAHSLWVQSRPDVVKPGMPERLHTRMSALGLGAYIPDLAGAGLRYADVRRVRMSGGDGLHVGYLGTHGCMLSLVVTPNAGELRATLGLYEGTGGRVYGWRGARYGYLLLADYMAPARLAVIAEMLVKVTRERRPLDELMRIALARSREVNPPCA